MKYRLDSNTEYPFKVLDSNEDYDIAIISINTRELNAAKLGDSDKLAVGQEIVAIGNPLNLSRTLSTGIISAIRQEEWAKYIQVTAPITYGSSGGGLFDRYGRLVGITTFGFGGALADINFAVPINDVVRFIPDSGDLNNAVFKNKISKNAKELFWYLHLKYPQPNKFVTYKLRAKYYQDFVEDFFIAYKEYEIKGYISPTWTGSYIYDEFLPRLNFDNGAQEFIPGRYKIELYSEDKLVASGVVEII